MGNFFKFFKFGQFYKVKGFLNILCLVFYNEIENYILFMFLKYDNYVFFII